MIELVYTGKGFLGYDKDDKKMFLIEKRGQHDYWVKYKGMEMLVRNTEVMPKGDNQ